MPDHFKVDLAPALLCSAFAERYPEQPALHHNGATDFKKPDGSVSPKWSQSQSWTEQALHRQEHPVSWKLKSEKSNSAEERSVWLQHERQPQKRCCLSTDSHVLSLSFPHDICLFLSPHSAALSSGAKLDAELFGMGLWSLGFGAIGAALAGIFLANTDLCLPKAAKAQLEYLEDADLRSTTDGGCPLYNQPWLKTSRELVQQRNQSAIKMKSLARMLSGRWDSPVLDTANSCSLQKIRS